MVDEVFRWRVCLRGLLIKTYLCDMENIEIITEATKYIEELFCENHDGHDAGHTMRVLKNAQELLLSFPEADAFIVQLAVLLHDADDHKLFSTENNYNARSFMEKMGVDPEIIELVCDAINSVSFSKNRGKTPATIEGKIVQDADRLDALGAIGIARTFAYGGKNGRSLEDSIQHFYDKLLLLKDEMNTEEAREMARKRHDFMKKFLDEYSKE